jgi:hypothetical protein
MAATYDASTVSVIVGSHIVKGIADGTFVSITRNSDTYTKKIGAAGEVARVKTSDRSGRMTITLAQTSPSNDYFSGLYIADETRNAGKVPVLVTENGGTSVAKAGEAWIVKPANLEYGNDIINRVWIFELADLVMTVGSVPQ